MTLPKRVLPRRTPRRCPPNLPGKPWSAAEDAVLLVHYEHGGTPACLPHLPGRSRVAIYRRALRHGLESGFKPTPRLDAHQREELHAVVTGATRTTVAQLADRWGMSEGAVRKQIRKKRQRLKHSSGALEPSHAFASAPAAAITTRTLVEDIA